MKASRMLLLATAILAAFGFRAGAQIYVASFGSDTIGAYRTSGGTINASLVTGLSDPSGIVYANGLLYVTNQSGPSAAAYTTDGVNTTP